MRMVWFCRAGLVAGKPLDRNLLARVPAKSRAGGCAIVAASEGVLVEHGMNVLLFDYRNSGESAGEMTSVGQYEVRDLLGGGLCA